MRKLMKNVSHLVLPISVMVLLIIINLVKGADYFTITMINGALYGNIPNILFGASELVILSIGMTLVTAASRGQDISIGESATISSAVFVWFVLRSGEATPVTIIVGFLLSCVVGLGLGAFNGILVSIFKVQPMVASLILFTGGRSIAFMIDGKLSPILANDISNRIGTVIPGIPIQTPVILTAVFIALFAVLLKTTTLRLYVETVGINPNAARLNGINPKKVIFLTFLIMGFCSAVAGFIAVNKAGRHDSVNLLKNIMMDAILAVAIGGNSLGGGTFSITGSIIGAYTIEMLNRTLLRLEIEPAMIKVFKAIFIVILMVVASPVVRDFIKKVLDRNRTRKEE
ncbi:MAG: Inner membrane ABC transporter permease protein YtfT [Spirochaetes bacterium ADurb.Bin315]|nr:ABC transporter permease [Spirochaetales bacterium]OQA45423.1 MAG: Inner membrane ABC transporter permease protein YtfT [Spirochaetes bacterium ADurb.Bin315]HPB42493.1 ABC transporter permease [Sphaerochaeta sp.]HPY44618.1 ABC transporter permease [Sphaerochaeta sp.]HQB04565.1 ABC transporter permease [Sphaerochaeta sp.]